MTPLECVLIFIAGLGAGTINSVVGSGTLLTFPTLVAFGYSPLVATMTNSVGLLAGGLSGSWGYRRELMAQRHRLARQLPATVIGAVTGAWLLLHLPPDTFEKVVPGLLVVAMVLVLAQKRIQGWVRRRAERAGRDQATVGRGRMALLILGTYLTGVYGGYFAAAQGVLLVGMMGAILPDDIRVLNAARNLLSSAATAVGAVYYTIAAHDQIQWRIAGLIAVGALIGGYLGARFGRRISPRLLRAFIVALCLVAIWRVTAVS